MLPLSEHLLLVSGRGAFEIVQKALVAGLPDLGVGAGPLEPGRRPGASADLTLIGFLRGERFIVYSGGERLQA